MGLRGIEGCTCARTRKLLQKLTVLQVPTAANMASQQSTRIWETDNPSAAPPNRTSHPQSATLPSISTLTNELPPGANGASSPAYPGNRSSDQWATPPQSTRKLHLLYNLSALSSRIGLICSLYCHHMPCILKHWIRQC